MHKLSLLFILNSAGALFAMQAECEPEHKSVSEKIKTDSAEIDQRAEFLKNWQRFGEKLAAGTLTSEDVMSIRGVSGAEFIECEVTRQFFNDGFAQQLVNYLEAILNKSVLSNEERDQLRLLLNSALSEIPIIDLNQALLLMKLRKAASNKMRGQ